MNICDYGCGLEAKHQFKNGKWCCSHNISKCTGIKEKYFLKDKNHFFNKTHSNETKNILREQRLGKKVHNENWLKLLKEKMTGKSNPYYGKKHNNNIRTKIKLKRTYSINKWRKLYPTFAKIEEMRYEPGKEKVIQVHCKNHNCPNSKEQGGWFTPTKTQFYERLRQLEYDFGNDAGYFYCSEECKQECPLFHKSADQLLISNNKKELYTYDEYQIFREKVLTRENYKCEYCGNEASHVHHSRPQKLEPGFALDPDFGIACCSDCHYKYGHKTGTECSTGNLANKICM